MKRELILRYGTVDSLFFSINHPQASISPQLFLVITSRICMWIASHLYVFFLLRTKLLVNSDIDASCFVYAIMLTCCSVLLRFLPEILPLLTLPLKSISMSHLACKLNVVCFKSLAFLFFLCVNSLVLASFLSSLGDGCN